MKSWRRTTTTDDGRRTTDESALEKLRCLSAGGAKKETNRSGETTPTVSTIWWNHFHCLCLLYGEITAKQKQNVTVRQTEVVKPLPLSLSIIWWNHSREPLPLSISIIWWNHSHCLYLLSDETTPTVSIYYLMKPLPLYICLLYSETTVKGTYSTVKWMGIFLNFIKNSNNIPSISKTPPCTPPCHGAHTCNVSRKYSKLSYSAKTKCDGWRDRQTDRRGVFQYLARDNYMTYIYTCA